jgi:hypothetical protein
MDKLLQEPNGLDLVEKLLRLASKRPPASESWLASLDAKKDWSSHAQCGWVRRKGWDCINDREKGKEEKGKEKKQNYERRTWSSHARCGWVRRKG